MALSNQEINLIARRIADSRTRVLLNHPFYGLLLMHLKFALDLDIPTAQTDAEKIYFSPDFVNDLKDSELDFIMMHELLHDALGHCFRGLEYEDKELFNIACDIVVNSNILHENHMDLNSISIGKGGASMHKLPNGDEGYEHSVEDAYALLCMQMKKQGKITNGDVGEGDINDTSSDSDDSNGNNTNKKSSSKKKQNKNNISTKSNETPETIDSHEAWSGVMDEKKQRAIDEWNQWLKDAATAAKTMGGQGSIPAAIERYLEELSNPQVDWKEALLNFIQEEIVDYSFNPPDTRFQDSPFILPSFSEKEENAKNILFLIDTSGSMSDAVIALCYSEIKGAIEQFNGHLQGFLGFFDTKIYDVKPFEEVEDILKMKPVGGGGTSFDIIFDYIDKHEDLEFKQVIILTDGQARYPEESRAKDLPTLWTLIDAKEDAPWGKSIHIKSGQK